jgi:predicted transcriptional regulator
VTTLVRDLMHSGVVRCNPEYSLGQVANLLAEHHVHSLFIFNEAQLPIGVITDYDVMAGEWLSGDPESLEVMRGMTARELMSSPVEMIDIDTPADEAARRMKADNIRRLLVTENDKPAGVISVSDFLINIVSKTVMKREYVSDVMSDAYLVCRDKTPLNAAVRAMTDSGWRSVVVADPHGKPLGIFSGLDLLSLSEYDRIPDSLLVTELMHPPLNISIHATLNEAAKMMIDNHHHRILVIDPEHVDSLPLGVISSFDIVSEMARPNSVWQR